MLLIKSGIIRLITTKDERSPDDQFVIEKLGRGAVICPSSFIIQDDSDIDIKCSVDATCFSLSYEKMREVRANRSDL